MSIHEHFPFEQVRPGQSQVLNTFEGAENSTSREFRYRIFEAPTGLGKSPMAYAMLSWAKSLGPDGHKIQKEDDTTFAGGYILTTQKSLQEQYMRDFGHLGLTNIYGASNYICENHGTTCDSGKIINNELKNKAPKKPSKKKAVEDDAEEICTCSCCPYDAAKGKFADAPMGLTNFSLFLASAKYSNIIKKRSVLVIDEAHNTEAQILNFAEVEITQHRAREIGYADNWPVFDPDSGYATQECVKWVRNKFFPVLDRYLLKMSTEIQNASGENRNRLAGRKNGLTQLQGKLISFVEGGHFDDWIVWTNKVTHAIIIKPLTATLFAEDILFKFAKRIVLMSATILDANSFINCLGISRDKCGYLSLDSEFPVDNRLVHFRPCGSMSYKKKEATLPNLLKGIQQIIHENDTTKGLIHCQSFELQNAILKAVAGTPAAKRILTATQGIKGSRENAIMQHLASKEPTILLSPSMTEGLDLKDDHSRWQILAKVPYPSLADPFIKARLNRDPAWYAWMTALAITQSTGRSVRSATDYASTYILDSDFESFMSRSGGIFPEWWRKAIRYEHF